VKVNPKQCDGPCGLITIIYKNLGRQRFCKKCWFFLNPPKLIKHTSTKRQKEVSKYSREKADFLKDNPYCQLKLSPRCLIYADQIHHTRGKENWRLLDKKYWKSACGICHDIVTEHSELVFESGASVSKHKLDNNEKRAFSKGEDIDSDNTESSESVSK